MGIPGRIPAPDEYFAAVEAAVQAARAKKAEDAVVLDLRPTADFTDFFVLLSGSNQRQLVAIADAVRVLILEDIPRLSADNYNQARRFVTLIDALYEARVRLIATAADEPERLYLEGEGSFEFERTASRLTEMQSHEYLSRAHLS